MAKRCRTNFGPLRLRGPRFPVPNSRALLASCNSTCQRFFYKMVVNVNVFVCYQWSRSRMADAIPDPGGKKAVIKAIPVPKAKYVCLFI